MKNAKRNYSPLVKVRLLMTMLLLSFLFISSGKIQTAYAEQSSCSNAAFSTNIQTPTGISATPSLDNINPAFEDVGYPIKVKVNTPGIAIPSISSKQYSNIKVLSSLITYNYVIKDTKGDQKASYENRSDQVKLSYDVKPNFQYQVYVQAVYKASVQYTDATNKTNTSSLTVKSTWGKSNRFKIYEEFEGEYELKIDKDNQIIFIWDRDSFISGNNNVEFYRSTKKDGSYKYCGKALYKDKKFIDKKALSEKDYSTKTTTYYYKLRYTNSSKKTAFSKPYKVVKYSAYPVLKSCKCSKNGKTTIKWKTGPKYASQAGSMKVRIETICFTSKKRAYREAISYVPFSQGTWTSSSTPPNGRYQYKVSFSKNHGYPVCWNVQKYTPFYNGIQIKYLEASTDSKFNIKLKWRLTTKYIDGFEIYRSFKKDGTYKKVKTLKGSSTLHWTDTWSKQQNQYYKVRTYFLRNGKKIYAPFSKPVRVKFPELGKVTYASTYMKAVKQIKLQISCNEKVSGIEIYRSSTGKHGAYKKVYAKSKKRDHFKWVDKNTTFGKTYYYKMRAYTKLGKKKFYSKDYIIKKQSTLPRPTIPFEILDYISGHRSSFSWKPVTSADGYYVKYTYYYSNPDQLKTIMIKKQGNKNCTDNWYSNPNIIVDTIDVYPYKMYNGKAVLGEFSGGARGADL